MKVTIFKNVFDKEAPHHIQIQTALTRIQNGKSKELIDKVRDGDKQKKRKLPIVCFSGEFSERADDALFEHSGFIVLDFDHVNVDATKTALATDQYVHSCWISPSGDGVKALVQVTNPERHRDHFRALCTYFEKQYTLEVDESGINESRACFESYDPDIIIKDEWKKFGAFSTEFAEAQTPTNESYKYTDYMKLNLAARIIRNCEDGDKHRALVKAARLCGGYIAAGRMEEDEAVRVLFREICKRDLDSEDQAMSTIVDMIQNGKNMPIREIIDEEKQAQREMLINDGDMSFISSDDEDFRWIDDYANGEIEIGLDTGDVTLDEYFRYKKEFVIINGHSNVGKTTTALYLIANSAIRHGWKWILYSSENRTASVKMQLMQFAADRKINDMTYAQRKQAYKWVQDHFTIINNNQVYSYSDIIVFMEKIMRQQEVDAIFVDPYNSLKLDMKNSNIGVHDYHYEAASEFLTFSTANNVAVWLNMHAVTEAQRRKGPDGLPIAPFAEDTEGGGKFVNRADCFVTIHRKVQSPDHNIRKMSEFHVRKVREVETGGQPTPFDQPYRLLMNLSHTGFTSFETRKQLFQPVHFEGDKQSLINFSDFMSQ
jgi:replicative DNA helicase